MSWEQFTQHLAGGRADAGLAADLANLLPDSTDDVALR